jgi:hypothetical protein
MSNVIPFPADRAFYIPVGDEFTISRNDAFKLLKHIMAAQTYAEDSRLNANAARLLAGKILGLDQQ